MAKASHLVVAFLLGCVLQDFYVVALHSDGELFETLLARIESVEASDAANKAKIADIESESEREISGLKLKMAEMESKFSLQESTMLDEINVLKTKLGNYNGGSAEQQPGGHDVTERRHHEPNRIQRRGNNVRPYREAPEHEVAFYATHQDHDIHHMGSNQVLEFPVVVTNVGNGYNNNTGGFTAPVDGTYVVHATVMGIDIQNNTFNHIRAHFDVNGTRYSMFYVTPFDQSSQLLVIELKAGQTVTVRND